MRSNELWVSLSLLSVRVDEALRRQFVQGADDGADPSMRIAEIRWHNALT
jgi:hypothetical protein